MLTVHLGLRLQSQVDMLQAQLYKAQAELELKTTALTELEHVLQDKDVLLKKQYIQASGLRAISVLYPHTYLNASALITELWWGNA